MDEAPDNGKESLHSGHTNGMNRRHALYIFQTGSMDKLGRQEHIPGWSS
jgi:hypothetical protein